MELDVFVLLAGEATDWEILGSQYCDRCRYALGVILGMFWQAIQALMEGLGGCALHDSRGLTRGGEDGIWKKKQKGEASWAAACKLEKEVPYRGGVGNVMEFQLYIRDSHI
jgi:hypothetical protein